MLLNLRPRRSGSRGAATVEAILTLFIFVLVWAGVSWMGTLYSAQLRTHSLARSCAFRISLGACGQIPPECESLMRRGRAGGKKGERLQAAGEKSTRGGGLSKLLQGPLMNQLTALFSERADIKAHSVTKRPPLLGGGEIKLQAGFSLPCNTKETSVTDVASDMMKSVLGDEP